jgi:hypothetical protein
VAAAARADRTSCRTRCVAATAAAAGSMPTPPRAGDAPAMTARCSSETRRLAPGVTGVPGDPLPAVWRGVPPPPRGEPTPPSDAMRATPSRAVSKPPACTGRSARERPREPSIT